MGAEDIYKDLEQADSEIVMIYHNGNSERDTAKIFNKKHNGNISYSTVRDALIRAEYNRRNISDSMKLFWKKRKCQT